jgi:hypothetical protein
MRLSRRMGLSACVFCLTGMLFSANGALSAEDEFEIEWGVVMVTDTWFCGENVTFMVVSYVADSPSIRLPGQYANIAIINETGYIMYDAWVQTGENGTAIGNWDSLATDPPGIYLITLTDGLGFSTTTPFTLVFDQDVYWQSLVDELFADYAQLYEYMDYLFADNYYMRKKVADYDGQMRVFFFTLLGMLLVTMYEWFPGLAKRLSETDTSSPLKAGLSLLGFTNKLRSHVDHLHEDMASTYVPPDKEPPRMGPSMTCVICDPKGERPMKKFEFDEHMLTEHSGKGRKRLPIQKERLASWAVEVAKDLENDADERDGTPAVPARRVRRLKNPVVADLEQAAPHAPKAKRKRKKYKRKKAPKKRGVYDPVTGEVISRDDLEDDLNG